MKLPAEERVLRLGRRIDQLRAGAGNYTQAERAEQILDATRTMDAALAELHMQVAWGHHVVH